MISKRVTAVCAVALSLPLTGTIVQSAATAAETACVQGCTLNPGAQPTYATYSRAGADTGPVNGSGNSAVTSINCDAGDEVVGGGYRVSDADESFKLLGQGPSEDNPAPFDGWTVRGIPFTGDTFQAIVECRDTAV